MNYYKQGDAAKADQIKAAFEKLGYNTGNLGFTSGQLYYTVEGKVELMCTKSLQNLIKTHPDYNELELPVQPKFKFKVGDWIVHTNGSSDIPIQVYGLKKDIYLVTNMLGSKWQLMINRQDEWRLWAITDAKDGDVLVAHEVIGLFKEIDGLNIRCHFSYHYMNTPTVFTNELHNKMAFRPATKDERELLFAKMKEAGYEWDADKKELRKIKPHYDIANFKPFDKVLVRDCDTNGTWKIELFSHRSKDGWFICVGSCYCQCIPFNEETKHLLGTTDMCSEEYINW